MPPSLTDIVSAGREIVAKIDATIADLDAAHEAASAARDAQHAEVKAKVADFRAEVVAVFGVEPPAPAPVADPLPVPNTSVVFQSATSIPLTIGPDVLSGATNGGV